MKNRYGFSLIAAMGVLFFIGLLASAFTQVISTKRLSEKRSRLLRELHQNEILIRNAVTELAANAGVDDYKECQADSSKMCLDVDKISALRGGVFSSLINRQLPTSLCEDSVEGCSISGVLVSDVDGISVDLNFNGVPSYASSGKGASGSSSENGFSFKVDLNHDISASAKYRCTGDKELMVAWNKEGAVCKSIDELNGSGLLSGASAAYPDQCPLGSMMMGSGSSFQCARMGSVTCTTPGTYVSRVYWDNNTNNWRADCPSKPSMDISPFRIGSKT